MTNGKNFKDKAGNVVISAGNARGGEGGDIKLLSGSSRGLQSGKQEPYKL